MSRRTGTCFDGANSTADNHEYSVLDDRLNTFILPPPWRGPLGFQSMAEAGFVYTGQEDLVYCFSCNIKLDGWTKHMDPFLRHKEESPTCSFVKRLRKRRRKDKLVTAPLDILTSGCCSPVSYAVVDELPVTQVYYPDYSQSRTRPQLLNCVVGSLESTIYSDNVKSKHDEQSPFMMDYKMDARLPSRILSSDITVHELSSALLQDDKPRMLFGGESSDEEEDEDSLFADYHRRFGEVPTPTSSLCRQHSSSSNSSRSSTLSSLMSDSFIVGTPPYEMGPWSTVAGMWQDDESHYDDVASNNMDHQTAPNLAMEGEEASITPYLHHRDNCFMCQICNNEIVDTVLLPCRHAKMCMNCVQKIMLSSGNCPYCRQLIYNTDKIYT